MKDTAEAERHMREEKGITPMPVISVCVVCIKIRQKKHPTTGTSGNRSRPVLDLLHAAALECALIVVRISGVLLGTGGLTRAYGTAPWRVESVGTVKLTTYAV